MDYVGSFSHISGADELEGGKGSNCPFNDTIEGAMPSKKISVMWYWYMHFKDYINSQVWNGGECQLQILNKCFYFVL